MLKPMTTTLKSQEAAERPQVLEGSPSGALERENLRDLDALKGGNRRERCEAAASLPQYGGEAFEPLCAVLADPDDHLKIAAANALAALGDPRAIPAITKALRDGLVGGNAREHMLNARFTLGLALGGTLLLVILLDLPQPLFQVLAMQPLIWWSHWQRGRHARSRVHEVFADAIVTLGEVRPTLELRELLSDFRTLAADRLQQAPEARQAFTEAAERIDLLTRDLKVLPIAATGPPLDRDSLPRPAKAPASSAENLPVVESAPGTLGLKPEAD